MTNTKIEKSYFEKTEDLETDYYQLTTAYAYFKNGKHKQQAYFDMFYRRNPDNGGFSISAGLDDVVDYVKNFNLTEEDIEYLRSLGEFDEDFLEYLLNIKFEGDIWAIPDGTVVFPNEPLITIKADLVMCQLLETKMLNRKNHATLIATKANRMVRVAEKAGADVFELGLRRAQGKSAGLTGAKCAYIAGAKGTSNVLSGQKDGLPIFGTHPHSWIMSFPTEYEAMCAWLTVFPNKPVLVDTYDTLNSGIPNAIRAAKDLGVNLTGIRLDSGDMAYLSIEARKMLDEAGFPNAKITASNDLDEFLVETLISQGARIDTYGIGTSLITAKSDPAFGGVLKLAGLFEEDKLIDKIKMSDNAIKTSNPGYKKTYRFYDKETGLALGDVIALANEVIPLDEYTLIKENENWKRKTVTNYTLRELQVPIFINGELVYEVPSLEEVRNKVKEEINTIDKSVQRFANPHEYIVDLSLPLQALKETLRRSHYEEKEAIRTKKIGAIQ